MNFGDILIYSVPPLALTSIYLLLVRKRTDYIEKILIALLSVQSLSLIMLISFFYTTNLEYKYVSDYSSTDLNLFYKFSGLWAGRD